MQLSKIKEKKIIKTCKVPGGLVRVCSSNNKGIRLEAEGAGGGWGGMGDGGVLHPCLRWEWGAERAPQLAAGQGIGSVASPGAPRLEEPLQLQTWGLEEPLQLQTWRHEAAALPQLPARRTHVRCLVEEKTI